MDRTMLFVLFSGSLVLGAPSTVIAQRWGHESFPRDGVCFFKDPHFRGEYFCAGAGDSVRAVPDDMNDRISSIRIYGRAEVTVFRDVRFSGDSSRFRGNIENLKDEGWNDRISSFRVASSSSYENDRQGRPSYGRQDADRIVRNAYQDILHRDPDEGGLRQYRSRIIDDGWTEAEVRNSLRSSPEYRELTTMTPAKAQEIVRRAYRSVLKRDPDAASQGYVDRVMRERWSQEDVERELRKSPEYREKNR